MRYNATVITILLLALAADIFAFIKCDKASSELTKRKGELC
jgi:hypothetical protein